MIALFESFPIVVLDKKNHFAALGKPSPNIDHFVTCTSQLALDLLATTLTYSPKLAKVKVNPHAKNQCCYIVEESRSSEW